MDAAVTPEPDDEAREAILAALAEDAADTSSPAESRWREAGLREATEEWIP